MKGRVSHDAVSNRLMKTSSTHSERRYTAVSTKVVPQKCKSVRENADWYYG